jgi:protein-S-isoprenylcysteine O-methyltransferase Ste14
MKLALRGILFTFVVPGTGGAYLPWWILTRGGAWPTPAVWPAIAVVALGALLYGWCLWVFASAGRGTPGPWDPPRRLVISGPYRWVRNPIYLAAFLVVLGEAWLYLSLDLLEYAGILVLVIFVIVVAYEEPSLRSQFGEQYETYRRTVRRWFPSPPRKVDRA